MEKSGKLLHRFRDQESGISGNLNDYAFFVYGLIDLYQATFDWRYLERAIGLTDIMVETFFA